MEANQYRLCEEVLRRLHGAGALDGMVVAGRRSSEKAENDRSQAVMVLRAVTEAGDARLIGEVYRSLPSKWRRAIDDSLRACAEPNAIRLIGVS